MNVEYNNAVQILKQTDYIAIKIAEGADPLQYADVLALRQRCRDRLNEWDDEAQDFKAPTFEDLKGKKWREISQAHKNYVTGGFMTSLGYPMQFNITDSIMVEGAIKIAEATGQENIYLTDSNDVTHYDVPIADARMVLLEMSTAFAEAHAKKQRLRAEVESATTQEQLDEITW